MRQAVAAQALLELVEVACALLVAHRRPERPAGVVERLAAGELRGLPGDVAAEVQRVEREPAAVLLEQLAREPPAVRGAVMWARTTRQCGSIRIVTSVRPTSAFA